MKHSKSTLTLIELVVTLLILVGLSAILIPLYGGVVDKSRKDVAKVSFQNLRDVIMGTPQSPGYFQDIGFLPAKLKDLYIRPEDDQIDPASGLPTNLLGFDPVTKLGWRGPYANVTNVGKYEVDNSRGFTSDYGQGDGAGNIILNDDPCPLDIYGNPYIIQFPTGESYKDSKNVRLVSAGPNGRIECDPDSVRPDQLSVRGDDAVLFLRVHDPFGKEPE